MAKKSERQKLRDKLDREYLQGYRVGFDKGYVDGRMYGRSEIREQFRDLLGVDPSVSAIDVAPRLSEGKTAAKGNDK